MAAMGQVVMGQFGADYPVLIERQRQIERVLTHEEETFGRTLSNGLHRFQDEVAKLRAVAPADREVMQLTVPGAVAFRLYDTYGFPLDLTVDLAREQGMTVDIEGFDAAMAEQRVISRGGAAFKDASRERTSLYIERVSTTEFLGYEASEADATILALLDPSGFVDTAEAGDEVEIVRRRAGVSGEFGERIAADAVAVTRATREHDDVRVGSSVRGAIDTVAVAAQVTFRSTGEQHESEVVER